MLGLTGKLLILCASTSAIHTQQKEQSKERRNCDDYRQKLDKLTRIAYGLAIPYRTDFLSTSQLISAVEEIRKIQKDKPPKDKSESQRESAIEAFAEWSNKHLEIDGVSLHWFEGNGLGVVATRDLPIDHIVLKLPQNYTLSTNQSIPMLAACFGSKIDHVPVKYESYWNWTMWLALRLAAERLNLTTAYSTYIDVIPYTFTHVHYYSIDDLKHLQGSNAYEVAIWMYQELVVQYATLAQILLQGTPPDCTKIGFTPETFTFDLYRWAVTAVVTRADSYTKDLRLVPFWDMINHESPEPTVEEADKWERGTQYGGYFVARTIRPVAKGQELGVEYEGLHCEMYKFFATWDMVIPEATVPIDLRPFPFDPEFEYRKTAPLTHDLSTETETNEINVSPHLPILVQPSDFGNLLEASTGNLLSNYNESMWTRAYQYLLERVELRLRSYPISIESCERMLKDKDHGPHSKQALRFIIEEQRSLKQSADRLRKFIALKENPLTLSELETLIREQKQDEDYWIYKEQPKGLDSIPPYVKGYELEYYDSTKDSNDESKKAEL